MDFSPWSIRRWISRHWKTCCLLLVLLLVLQLLSTVIVSPASLAKTPTVRPKKSGWERLYGPDTFDRNPIYGEFHIPTVDALKTVDLLVIVTSAPGNYERRKAIRETWWKQCRVTQRVVSECIFLTDAPDNSTKNFVKAILEHERKDHDDLKFQNIPHGVHFGARFLFHLVYAVKNYYFDYLLRLDDDVFFCMGSFLQMVPTFPAKKLHWGYVHCDKNKTRPDESIILFSSDLVLKFLLQDPQQMMCHPFADQMLGVWLQELNLGRVLRHDLRIHHHPPVQDVPRLREMASPCNRFLAIHGAYSYDIKLFWRRERQEPPKFRYRDTTTQCANFSFDWRNFGYWEHEPKPCIEKPTWSLNRYPTRNGQYVGRQHAD